MAEADGTNADKLESASTDPAGSRHGRFTPSIRLLARSAPMAHKKLTLLTKTCVACARPFAWRKKWARDWDKVKFCSDRCRAQGAAAG